MSTFKRLLNHFTGRLLHIELKDAYCKLRFTHVQIFKLCRSIYNCIPYTVCDSFFFRQTGPLQTFFMKERSRFDKKFNHLKLKSISRNVITPIQCYCSIPPPHKNSTYSSNLIFSLKPDESLSFGEKFKITADPARYGCCQPFLHLRENWFVNLSTVSIPRDVQVLLQLGENFSLPSFNLDKLTMELIKNLENNLRSNQQEHRWLSETAQPVLLIVFLFPLRLTTRLIPI